MSRDWEVEEREYERHREIADALDRIANALEELVRLARASQPEENRKADHEE